MSAKLEGIDYFDENKLYLIRNSNTGIIETYKNGKKMGEIRTMGDNVKKDAE